MAQYVITEIEKEVIVQETRVVLSMTVEEARTLRVTLGECNTSFGVFSSLIDALKEVDSMKE